MKRLLVPVAIIAVVASMVVAYAASFTVTLDGHSAAFQFSKDEVRTIAIGGPPPPEAFIATVGDGTGTEHDGDATEEGDPLEVDADEDAQDGCEITDEAPGRLLDVLPADGETGEDCAGAEEESAEAEGDDARDERENAEEDGDTQATRDADDGEAGIGGEESDEGQDDDLIDSDQREDRAPDDETDSSDDGEPDDEGGNEDATQDADDGQTEDDEAEEADSAGGDADTDAGDGD